MRLRPLAALDLDRVSELNDAAAPAVPVTPRAELEQLVALASLAVVAVDDEADGDGSGAGGTVRGFLIGVDPGGDYASENYRFFERRGVDHLYIDRVVVAPEARGTGVGRALYERVLAEAAAAGRAEVTCEVNLDPPNPVSLAFHERMGFRRIGEQPTKGGSVVVALLARAVPVGGPAGG